MAVQCLLWDFGDTLFDELSLWRVSPQWLDVYRSFDEADGPGVAWNLGRIGEDEFADQIAQRSGMPRQEILNHLARFDLFAPLPSTMQFFRRRHRPQAIVTVNPTMFRRLADQLGLTHLIDTMVISGEEGSIDKALLCQRALERMSIDCSPAEALLIDNIPSNVHAWVKQGGIGYVHRGDARFRVDSAGGVDGLIGD